MGLLCTRRKCIRNAAANSDIDHVEDDDDEKEGDETRMPFVVAYRRILCLSLSACGLFGLRSQVTSNSDQLSIYSSKKRCVGC